MNILHHSEGEDLAKRAMIQEILTKINLPIDDLENTYSCHTLNVSTCDIIEEFTNERMVMIVWNSLPRTMDFNMRLPVPIGSALDVYDIDGSLLPLEYIPIRDEVVAIPGRGSSSADKEAVFKVTGVPPLGK